MMSNQRNTARMKKSRRVVLRVLFVVVCITFTQAASFAQTSVRLGGGISTTYDNVNAVLGTTNITTPSGARQFVSDAQFVGYHAAARLMLPLAENIGFTLGGAYHRFGNVRVNVIDPMQPSVTISSLNVSQTIIPLSGGLEFRLVRLLLLSLYLTGDVSYNIFSSTADPLPVSVSSAGVSVRDNYNRVGGNVGVGVDMMLGSVGVDVCVRYNHANLIGRTSAESPQTFLSLTASLVLGKK
jgi:hypothetical protein